MYTQRSKIFDTLLVTNILKYYADKGLADEFMIYFSKRTREMRGTYGGGLYRYCKFGNYITDKTHSYEFMDSIFDCIQSRFSWNR